MILSIMGSIYSVIFIVKSIRFLTHVSGCDKQFSMWYNFSANNLQYFLIFCKHCFVVIFAILLGLKAAAIVLLVGYALFVFRVSLYSIIKNEQIF